MHTFFFFQCRLIVVAILFFPRYCCSHISAQHDEEAFVYRFGNSEEAVFLFSPQCPLDPEGGFDISVLDSPEYCYDDNVLRNFLNLESDQSLFDSNSSDESGSVLPSSPSSHGSSSQPASPRSDSADDIDMSDEAPASPATL